MRASRQVRVLMLGWEYPPRYAGGLGKACRGLSQALARQGAQVFFIVPSFPERISETRLEVVGAGEALLEAGWTRESIDRAAFARSEGRVFTSRSDAQLFPYGGAPEGPLPEALRTRLEAGTAFTAPPPARDRPPLAPGGASAPTSGGSELYGKNLWSEMERYCFAVRQMAETHEVDVIHAHDWMTFPAAFEAQAITGAPVYLHVHATEFDRSGENVSSEIFRIEREGFRRANGIFAVSRYTAGVIERFYGVHRQKIHVIYNAPDEEAKQLRVSPDAPREPQVVFLGRLTFQKGPDHFLRAAQRVAAHHPQARFVFCGSGDLFQSLRVLAHELDIEDRVHFAGFVDPAGVDEVLARSRVLVMPSISEPFGLVALEAIHNGIPVILSKQSGVREVLSRALQVDFWDHERLADQILAALRLPALSRQLVQEGLLQVRSLSWDRSARKVIRHYRSGLGFPIAQAIGGGHGH